MFKRTDKAVKEGRITQKEWDFIKPWYQLSSPEQVRDKRRNIVMQAIFWTLFIGLIWWTMKVSGSSAEQQLPPILLWGIYFHLAFPPTRIVAIAITFVMVVMTYLAWAA